MIDGATELHYKSLLQSIKYVLDTKNYTLKTKPKMDGNHPMNFERYSDCEYAGDKDSKKCSTRLLTCFSRTPIFMEIKRLERSNFINH